MRRRQYTYWAINQGITLWMVGNLNCFPSSFSGGLNCVKITFFPGVSLGFFLSSNTQTKQSTSSCDLISYLHKIAPHQTSSSPPAIKVQSFILQLCSATFIELWSPTPEKQRFLPTCGHMLYLELSKGETHRHFEVTCPHHFQNRLLRKMIHSLSPLKSHQFRDAGFFPLIARTAVSALAKSQVLSS